MVSVLAGIPGVAIKIDDMVIHGPTPEIHANDSTLQPYPVTSCHSLPTSVSSPCQLLSMCGSGYLQTLTTDHQGLTALLSTSGTVGWTISITTTIFCSSYEAVTILWWIYSLTATPPLLLTGTMTKVSRISSKCDAHSSRP